MTDEQQETGSETELRRLRVIIREEDLEDVKAHGGRINGLAPGGTEDVEGQVFILTRPRPGDESDDTEGQGRGSFTGLGQTEDDVEGQAYRWGLEPAGTDDVEGQGLRFSLVPDETDPTGQTWRLDADDTEGQGLRYGGLKPNDPDDTVGHLGVTPAPRPPVD